MKNINDIKIKLIQKICESENYDLLVSTLKNFEDKIQTHVAEPQSIYNSEKAMTEQEIEEYFKQDKIELPKEILEILRLSEMQIENGRVYENEDVKLYFEEWLKD